MRVLAVDPGEKRIGTAISDPTGTIANPLTILEHTSRLQDALRIARLANEHLVDLIIVGYTLDEEGELTPQGRRAFRLAESIRQQTLIPVILWEESGSTQAARKARIAMGVARQKRRGHLDDLAATVILQDYLNHKTP